MEKKKSTHKFLFKFTRAHILQNEQVILSQKKYSSEQYYNHLAKQVHNYANYNLQFAKNKHIIMLINLQLCIDEAHFVLTLTQVMIKTSVLVLCVTQFCLRNMFIFIRNHMQLSFSAHSRSWNDKSKTLPSFFQVLTSKKFIG